jgi:two-component system, OmpR family, sensor histidine kinase KdpD
LQMESERLRNSLLAALSHDLRTPLAALVGTAETLTASQPPLSATQREMATSIGDMSRRTADMVSKLLDMARLQSGEVRLRTEWQSIEEIIGAALASARGALNQRTLSVQIDPAVSLVECDAVLIERVLANLLENAGKYTPAPTPVEILVREAGDELLVSVRDHGPGVPKGQEDLIFEKFTRGNTESATPGVGLGLAICRAIVQAHRGRIWVEPTHPAGATFTFSLPLGTPPAIDLTDDGLRKQRDAEF